MNEEQMLGKLMKKRKIMKWSREKEDCIKI